MKQSPYIDTASGENQKYKSSVVPPYDRYRVSPGKKIPGYLAGHQPYQPPLQHHHHHQHQHQQYMDKPREQTWSEYIPINKKHIEWVPETKIEYIPVEKEHTDYVEVKHQIDYVPIKQFDKKVEYIPVERLEERIEYVPHHNTYYNGQLVTDDHDYYHNHHNHIPHLNHPPPNHNNLPLYNPQSHLNHVKPDIHNNIVGQMTRSQYIAGQFSNNQQQTSHFQSNLKNNNNKYNHPFSRPY